MSAALHFEDLPVGYARELGWFALTQDEMIEFAERWDPAPFHVDPQLAASSFFAGIVASGLHTVSAIYRLLYDGLMSEIALTAGRGVEFRATAPVRPDERMTVRASVTMAHDAPRRPDQGVVRITAEAINPAGVTAMVATFEPLVRRRTPVEPSDVATPAANPD